MHFCAYILHNRWWVKKIHFPADSNLNNIIVHSLIAIITIAMMLNLLGTRNALCGVYISATSIENSLDAATDL
jgi:hypothetical protein